MPIEADALKRLVREIPDWPAPGVAVVIEIEPLRGTAKLDGYDVMSLVRY